VQRAELDALYEVIADLESRITVLKEMMQLVVSEVTPRDATLFDKPYREDNLRRRRSNCTVCGSPCDAHALERALVDWHAGSARRVVASQKNEQGDGSQEHSG
jgi:hypothetical protein